MIHLMLVAMCSIAWGGVASGSEVPSLVAHWPLARDASDASGRGHDGTAHGVIWDDKASGRFDGRHSVIDVPDHEDLKFGTGPFSVAAWVHTDTVLDDALGDLLSKFDPNARRGFTLSIMNYPGVTSCQSNWRNVHFGIDEATITQPWTDCGRPGHCMMVWALCVWNDNLYAGTFETEAGQAGQETRQDFVLRKR